MPQELIIIGAGGFGREVRTIFQNEIRQAGLVFKGFLGKDHGAAQDPAILPYMLGDPESYVPSPHERFVLAVGEMRHRRRLMETISGKGGIFQTLVHAQALVASNAELGQGVLVYPFAVISSESVLEEGSKLNFYASAGHNVVIGRCCLLAPYATVNGYSRLEHEVYMSTHATVGPQVTVGARSKLSANSAVTRDVPPDSFVFGVPGRIVPQTSLHGSS